jgi:MFS family permease
MVLTEGMGKAYISNLVPQEKIGTAFGVYQTAIGLCTFFASLIAGLLWTYINVSTPFIFDSMMELISAFLFSVFGGKDKTRSFQNIVRRKGVIILS